MERNTLKGAWHLPMHCASDRPNIILAHGLFHQLIMSFYHPAELRHFKLSVSCSPFGFCLLFSLNFTFCLKAHNHFLTINVKQSSKTTVYCLNLCHFFKKRQSLPSSWRCAEASFSSAGCTLLLGPNQRRFLFDTLLDFKE